eukprot:gene9851-biopygen12262
MSQPRLNLWWGQPQQRPPGDVAGGNPAGPGSSSSSCSPSFLHASPASPAPSSPPPLYKKVAGVARCGRSGTEPDPPG